ncbi:hypothetical protein HUJ04_010633 [Dendroctonus ponderosae]|nr:hypothetical protein HUJ04_010633 [Dendroctonus ponderosae]
MGPAQVLKKEVILGRRKEQKQSDFLGELAERYLGMQDKNSGLNRAFACGKWSNL